MIPPTLYVAFINLFHYSNTTALRAGSSEGCVWAFEGFAGSVVQTWKNRGSWILLSWMQGKFSAFQVIENVTWLKVLVWLYTGIRHLVHADCNTFLRLQLKKWMYFFFCFLCSVYIEITRYKWWSDTVVLVFLSNLVTGCFQGWCAFKERKQTKARTVIWWVEQMYDREKFTQLTETSAKVWIPSAWNKASAFICCCCLNQDFCLSSRSFLWKLLGMKIMWMVGT